MELDQRQPVDLLVFAEWVIPVIPTNRVYHHYAIAIRGELIVGLVDRAEANTRYQAKATLDLGGHVLLPGLINAHGHSPMTLFRGMANEKPLQQWLEQDIWPAEKRWVDSDFVKDGTQLAIAEMLLGGITCFSDMYFFPDAVASAAINAGIRTQLAFPILDFPTIWGSGPDEYIRKGTSLFDQFRDHPLIKIAFGPHSPYTVSRVQLERVAMLSEELQAMVHMHVHETSAEVAQAVRDTGTRPIDMLAEIGLLGPRMQCVHVCDVNASDIEQLAKTASHVVHCPESNLKLASGMCPVAEMSSNGINIALGTDGAASNNDLDILGEMRSAALLAKGVSGDAAALPAFEALEMATINGARALGQAERIGSLEIGKLADMIAIDLGELRLQPIYNPLSQLAYNQVSHRVSHVWVAGRALVNQYQLQTLDAEALGRRARQWSDKISGAIK